MQTKKSLGQYFLNSPQIIKDIVLAGNVEGGDTVLEIGPGQGVLTEELLQTGAKVISVEKDDQLIPELQKKFAREIALKQLDLVHADILDLELPHIAVGEYKIVANIPYYITGQIVRMFLESDNQPKSMTLLVQKEVAERIVAKDGKESLLSLSVKVFGEPKYIQTVSRGAFKPHPEVDSALLNIENISKNNFTKALPWGKGGLGEEFFFKILHLGFAHKRKQLLPNLASLYSKDKLLKVFKKCQIDPKSRAEDIKLDTWILLCKTLEIVM